MNYKSVFSVALSLCLLAACNSSAQQTNLPVPEFEKAIAQPNIQLLDVRSSEEYQSGHLSNALLANWNNENEFKTRVQSLDKTKPVYTYCLSGARSGAATKWLRENGFNAYNLEGGISAWKRADKLVEQAKAVRQISLSEYMAQIPTDKIVLVDFGAVWCPPCKKMAPVLDSLVARHGNQFVLVKIDGAEQTDICKTLKVEGFPTFIIYKNGKETWRKEGLADEKEFLKQF
jgi:rhodanese-related sulfurtransferase